MIKFTQGVSNTDQEFTFIQYFCDRIQCRHRKPVHVELATYVFDDFSDKEKVQCLIDMCNEIKLHEAIHATE